MVGPSGLPPIEVYRIDEVYFVLDGNHRVSVAREMGLIHLEGYVTEVVTRVPLQPDAQPDDLIFQAEYIDFIERTQQDELRPDADLQLTASGRYSILLEHIDVHRYHLGLECACEISYAKAFTSWYDTVYLPVVEIIRNRGLLRDFPKLTETDLYLWISQHRAELEQASARLFRPARERLMKVLATASDQQAVLSVTESHVDHAPRRPGRVIDDLLVAIDGSDSGWGALEQALAVALREPDQRGLAEFLGEWGFYAMAILIVLALVKRFPYHLFKKTHNWLAIAYLLLDFHSVVLTKVTYWSQPIGWILATLMLGGAASALLVLTGQVGARRRVEGVIKSLTHYPGLSVIEGTLEVDGEWKGHSPGQFAFVESSKREGAHPYTIASAWDPRERRLTFIAKELGDWTSQLRDRLKVGTAVSVEGPYGCFDFKDGRPRQIWIAGGIGITPFIAQMQHLAHNPGSQEIDLSHTTTDFYQTAIDKLTADAQAAGVRLHLFVTAIDGRLTGERIRAAVPGWRTAGVWFCGPAAFGDALRKDFLAGGLRATDFHRELFEMR